MNFLHAYNPSAIAVSIGSLDIRWYGIIIATAVLTGFLITFQIVKKKQVSTEHVYNLLFLIAIFGIIGGRIGHVIGEWDHYSSDALSVLRIWDGGLAFHGVLFGSLIVTYFYARNKKISFWLLTDAVVVGLPLMQSIGRWGNYFNQELYGKPTDLVWGIPINPALRIEGYELFTYFHPLFLYESLLMLVVFGFMFALYRSGRLQQGQQTLIYLIVFSGVRFSLDFFRIGMLEIGPLLLTQWLSVIIAFVALGILIRKKTHFKTQ